MTPQEFTALGIGRHGKPGLTRGWMTPFAKELGMSLSTVWRSSQSGAKVSELVELKIRRLGEKP